MSLDFAFNKKKTVPKNEFFFDDLPGEHKKIIEPKDTSNKEEEEEKAVEIKSNVKPEIEKWLNQTKTQLQKRILQFILTFKSPFPRTPYLVATRLQIDEKVAAEQCDELTTIFSQLKRVDYNKKIGYLWVI